MALSLIACSPRDRVAARSPSTGGIRIEASDPPPGARLVGPINGSDGPDCALLEARGTEEGALTALRKSAAERGIDFVKVTAVSKPYSDHTCVHKRYQIDGIGYALGTRPTAPACNPTCAAGYACRAGTCEAECDPACGPAQYCRFDRVCAPLPTAPMAPVAPLATPAPQPTTPAAPPVTPALLSPP
jgi:hypothetical protein